MARIFKDKKELYLEKLYAEEDNILKNIRHSAEPNLQRIQINPLEGKIIQVLLQIAKAQAVLEIGTLVGYSALWIARSLPDNGRVVCIEKSERNYKIAHQNLSNLPESHKIKLINDDAKKILKKIDEKFDAIFIDADKESYPFYLEHAYRILNPGGLIIADNTFCFGNVYDDPVKEVNDGIIQAIKKFNEMISNTSMFSSIIIPTNEGLTVAIKK